MHPQSRRQSLHPDFCEATISRLVDEFYEKVRNNEQLGPVFLRRIEGAWDQHLDTMKRFWRSVLMKTGEYKGKPVVVHQQIHEINTQLFVIWLRLFEETAHQIWNEAAAIEAVTAAQRIASSLWLAQNSDPFASPPTWNAIREDDVPLTHS